MKIVLTKREIDEELSRKYNELVTKEWEFVTFFVESGEKQKKIKSLFGYNYYSSKLFKGIVAYKYLESKGIPFFLYSKMDIIFVTRIAKYITEYNIRKIEKEYSVSDNKILLLSKIKKGGFDGR